MDRILQNVSGKITLKLYDLDAILADADLVPTVEIFDGAGAGHIASAASTRESLGTYIKTLSPAQTAVLDSYRAVWTATIATQAGNLFDTAFEVAGGFYFTVAEARTFDNGTLSDVGDHPTQSIIDGRELVEEIIEHECGVAFVRRGARETLSGADADVLTLRHRRPHELYSVTVDGDALAGGDLSEIAKREWGGLGRPSLWPAGDDNVVLHYSHGYATPPADIKRAALRLLKHHLLSSDLEDRTTQHTDEIGTRQLATHDADHPTGVPEVDAVIRQHREALPVVA